MPDSERSEHLTTGLNREASRNSHKASRLQVIAGVLALIAPALGVWVFFLNSNVQDQGDEIAKLRQQVEATSAQLKVANATIKTVQSDNLELKRALPATVDAADIPRLQKAGRVVLTSDYKLDLESVLPNFNLEPSGDFFGWLTYTAGVVKFNPAVGWVQLPQGQTASYATCDAVTNWRQDTNLNATLLQSGDVCLQLQSKRIATIVATDPQADQITMDIAVYQLP
jgi:hypothetical protein